MLRRPPRPTRTDTLFPYTPLFRSDKRNLALLGDARLLGSWGVDAALAHRLAQVIPSTVEVAPENREALWADRNGYFFKPAAGFGSRSEEHTSELQSLMRSSYAVFCLKKTKQPVLLHTYYDIS